MSFDATLSDSMETILANQTSRGNGVGRMNAMFSTDGNIEAAGPMKTMLEHRVGLRDRISMEYHMKLQGTLATNLEAIDNIREGSAYSGMGTRIHTAPDLTTPSYRKQELHFSPMNPNTNNHKSSYKHALATYPPLYSTDVSLERTEYPLQGHHEAAPHTSVALQSQVGSHSNQAKVVVVTDSMNNIQSNQSSNKPITGEVGVTTPSVVPLQGTTIINTKTIVEKDKESDDNDDTPIISASNKDSNRSIDNNDNEDEDTETINHGIAFETFTLRPTLIPTSVKIDENDDKKPGLSLEDQLANKLRRIENDALADLAESALKQRDTATNIKEYLLGSSKYNLIGKEVERRATETT